MDDYHLSTGDVFVRNKHFPLTTLFVIRNLNSMSVVLTTAYDRDKPVAEVGRSTFFRKYKPFWIQKFQKYESENQIVRAVVADVEQRKNGDIVVRTYVNNGNPKTFTLEEMECLTLVGEAQRI